MNEKVGNTVFAFPGRHFESYLRVRMTVDPTRPARERATSLDATVVAVGETKTKDEKLAALIGDWQKKLDAALGEEIGVTKKALAKDSPELGRWVASAIRESFGADVAIVNRKGMRGDLPAGPFKASAVYSVLPFDNTVLLLSITGEQLRKALGNEQAVFAGAKAAGKDFVDHAGRPIDPKRKYTVATVEYLYFGGDGFEFEAADPAPKETGMVWQTPVIEWTKKQSLSPKKTLESVALR
jgi:2',3'-cyclic-nucleotide 2'-phosphodiesterase (5'-nucleotidase family)